VQFNVDVSAIETDLQGYIDKNFDSVTLVEDSLTLLRKFLSILKRESLKQSIYNKYTVISKTMDLKSTVLKPNIKTKRLTLQL